MCVSESQQSSQGVGIEQFVEESRRGGLQKDEGDAAGAADTAGLASRLLWEWKLRARGLVCVSESPRVTLVVVPRG